MSRMQKLRVMYQPAGRGKRRPVFWLFLVTVLASAWALWWPEDPIRASRSESASHIGSGGIAAPLTADPSIPASSLTELGGMEQPLAWSSASADPFAPDVVEPQAEAPAPSAPIATNESPPAPPPPRPRPVYSVIGRMASPEGQALVLLARTDAQGFSAVAVPGLELDDGFTVQEVSAAGVRLLHAATGDVVILPVPAALP